MLRFRELEKGSLMKQVRKCEVVSWERANGVPIWGVSIEYMDGTAAANPIGNPSQVEQKADRLLASAERVEPLA
jgi:hypothetical protein